MRFFKNEDEVNCYVCRGRGIIYEVESYPADPDNASVNAETCYSCLGAGYVKKNRCE